MRVRPLDIAAVLLSLAAVAASAAAAWSPSGGRLEAVVRSGDREWIYPLDADETVAVEGPLGTTRVHIHDGRAEVESSPCKNQICVHAGAVSQNGQTVACLPNRVLVRIRGGNAGEEGVDARTW